MFQTRAWRFWGVGWVWGAACIICAYQQVPAACLREPPSCHPNTDCHRLPACLPACRPPALLACLPAACACLAWPFCSWRGLEQWWRSGGSGQQENSSSCAWAVSWTDGGSSSSGALCSPRLPIAALHCLASNCTPPLLTLARTAPRPTLPALPACLPACCCSGRGILNNPDLRPQSETTTKFADVKGVDEAKVQTQWGSRRVCRGCQDCLPASPSLASRQARTSLGHPPHLCCLMHCCTACRTACRTACCRGLQPTC